MVASTVEFPVASENPGGVATIATDQVDLGAGTAEVTYGKIVDGTVGGTDPLVVRPDGAIVTHDIAAPVGFANIASGGLAAAVSLPSLPAGAHTAIVAVEGGTVRYRYDGSTTAPTTTVGMPIRDGGTVALAFGHAALATTKLIAATGTPSIQVTYL